MHNLNPIVTAALGGKNAAATKALSIKNQSQHGLQSPPSAGPANGPGQMSPPNFHSPPGRQDSLQRTSSEDAYRNGSDAKPYDMQSQASGNFAPPPRPTALSNY